jgi:GH24 family phage-related lysozyme (muramidase)
MITFREYHDQQMILEGQIVDWASRAISEYLDLPEDEVRNAITKAGYTVLAIAAILLPYNLSKYLGPEEEAMVSNTSKDDIAQWFGQTNLPEIDPNNLPPLPGQGPVGPPPPAIDAPGADTNATAQQYFDRLAAEEGFRGEVYDDTGDNPTIGYGHHLNGSDQSTGNVEAALPGVSYDQLLDGTAAIDEVQGRALFDQDLEDQLAIARGLVPAFDTLPAEVELALADAAFRSDLQLSPDAVALMNNNQWVEAAAEYIDSDEYRASRAQGDRHGVWQRMDRNAAAFRQHGENLIRQQNNQ